MANLHDLAAQAPDQARQMARQAGNKAEDTATSPWAVALARFSYVAKGIVYLIMGLIAGRVALGAGGSVADTKGALVAIYAQPFGKTLLIVMGVGLAGYALWCAVRAALNVEHLKDDAKGIAQRLGYGAVFFTYVGLALAAFGLAAHGNGGKSTDQQAQDWTARFLALPFGTPLVVLGGIVVLGVAAALGYVAFRAEFTSSLKRWQMPQHVERAVIWLGQVGYAAIGVVMAIVGVFLIVAALQHDASKAKGLGGALLELTRMPFGPLVLLIVALGLLAYGAFSVAEAKYRRIGSH
jgi:hypothetical protein